jgi:hypothetical protein
MVSEFDRHLALMVYFAVTCLSCSDSKVALRKSARRCKLQRKFPVFFRDADFGCTKRGIALTEVHLERPDCTYMSD